jgi:release factor glutamine methyltransferase
VSAAAATSSVGDALGGAVDALSAAGCETARLDAELLLAEASGWDRARLAAEPELRLPVGASREFAGMVRRRVRREPVAYILGRKGFRRIEVLVDHRVLIPRPESELLVEVALDLGPTTVLDVGTGSGAIALAVADELPESRVEAIDVSMDALRIAQANVERLGLEDRVDVVNRGIASVATCLRERDRVDLLIANLPYVSEGEWEGLEPEIREFEPREALVAGPTGLEAIRALADQVGAADGRVATIALEVGAGQAEEVSGMLEAASFREVEVRPDLAGIERVVAGRR